MTTDITANVPPADAGASSSWQRLLSPLRDTPLRFLLLALLSGVLVYLALRETPWRPFASTHNDEAIAFAGGLVRLLAVVLLVAPLVALRRPWSATAMCVLPLVLTAVSGRVWPFSVFLALVAVMAVAAWRAAQAALVPGVLALLLPLSMVTHATTLIMPYGAVIEYGHVSGLALRDKLITLAMYAVAVAAVYGVAVWMRSSALKARRLTTLSARASEVEDEATVMGERARLARDLHDVVAHHVSLMAVRAETAQYTDPDLPESARSVLSDIAADARSALEELRGVLGVLRRSEDGARARAPQPELRDVQALVDKAAASGQATLDGDLSAPVGQAQGYVVYRVVQEALTNARRHAPGRPVRVVVLAEGDRLRVRVSNPYLEESRDRTGGGGGLVGMRERVEALGGQLRAGVEGDYFQVEAEMPRGAA